MALRLIEVVLSSSNHQYLIEMLKELKTIDVWYTRLAEDRYMTRILIPSEDSEKLTDALEKRFAGAEGFRLLVHSIIASIPRPELEENKETGIEEKKEEKKEKKIGRISREELYSGISDMSNVSKQFLITIALSVIVAAIGLVTNQVAVIIGAMVIAPLLGPNMALSLSTTLADAKLARIAFKGMMVGIFITIILSFTFGYWLDINPSGDEIAYRTNVNLSDFALALASGIAGALFITMGISTALVGVMLAVALLPPLVTFGLLLGAGFYDLSLDSLLLFFTNLICINLAGVLTFFVQGVRPLTWWEAGRAKNLTIIAIAIWCLLLITLAVLIALTGKPPIIP